MIKPFSEVCCWSQDQQLGELRPPLRGGKSRLRRDGWGRF